MKSTFSGLQFCRWQYGSISIRLAVVAFKMYKITRNYKKIRTYSSSRSSKVIDLGPRSSTLVSNRKPMYDFLLVINSNIGRISNRFRDIDAFSSKIACFPTYPLFDAPSGGTPWDINIIYSVSQKNPPCGFLKFFPKRLGIFNQFLTHLLYDHFYTRVQICIQISSTLTKLCHTKRDHLAKFYISLEL